MMKRNINGRVWEGDAEALDELERSVTETQKRQGAISREELQNALDAITHYLATGWSTGGGRRLRQFVWSLWNGSHLINLYDLSSGLDGPLTDATIVVFRAAMANVLTEEQKRHVLKQSGEFTRWDAAHAATPDNEAVLYPPLPIGVEALRNLARSAEKAEARLEQARREEAERFDGPRLGCTV